MMSFENDDALDWLVDLKSSGFSLIEATLNGIVDSSEDFLDACECAKAIEPIKSRLLELAIELSPSRIDESEWAGFVTLITRRQF